MGGGRKMSLPIPYRAALAKPLRYRPDIYARYGGDGLGCQPFVSRCSRVPALSRDPRLPPDSLPSLGPGSAAHHSANAPCCAAHGTRYRHEFAISRRDFARVMLILCLPRKSRAQGMPDARCTRGLVCQTVQKWRTRAYRFSGGSPTSPAQWLYGLYRALPGGAGLLSPSLANRSASLAPASRRQDHTTSPYALAFRPALKNA